MRDYIINNNEFVMAFKKGQVTNPKGRPKGVPNKKTELLNAIKYVQGRKKKKLLVHASDVPWKINKTVAETAYFAFKRYFQCPSDPAFSRSDFVAT